MLKNQLPPFLRRFCRDQRASISLEAVLLFPLLVWAYVATFVFFDAFRAQNTTLKAAYTLSDMLSRETDPVTQDYLDGLNTVFDYLTFTPNPTWIRVTVITWDEADDRFEVLWSETTKSNPKWTTATLQTIADQIPAMSNGDRSILVETTMRYRPAFRISFGEIDFENFVVTSPRFAPQLLWSNG